MSQTMTDMITIMTITNTILKWTILLYLLTMKMAQSMSLPCWSISS